MQWSAEKASIIETRISTDLLMRQCSVSFALEGVTSKACGSSHLFSNIVHRQTMELSEVDFLDKGNGSDCTSVEEATCPGDGHSLLLENWRCSAMVLELRRQLEEQRRTIEDYKWKLGLLETIKL